MGSKNPPWTRDETILALDLYVRVGGAYLEPSDPRILALSEELNKLGVHKSNSTDNKFRNPNGVGLKLMNLRFVATDGKHGMSRASSMDREVWKEFGGSPTRLRETANAILRNLNDSDEPVREGEPDSSVEAEAFPEGKILLRAHLRRERSSALTRKAKEARLAEVGCLRCDACGFDFLQTYGSVGEGFIECHHTVPVSSLGPDHRTKLSELCLLCANCHRMIHRKRPWLSLTELKKLLA